MSRTSNSLMTEKHEYAKVQSIGDKLKATLQFEKSMPLDPSLEYVIVPQKNFATEHEIDNETRISPRLWLCGIDSTNTLKTIRSISINTLLAMAFAEVVEGEAAPQVKARDDNGKWKPERGWKYVHALDDTSFIKPVDDRAVVYDAIALRSLGNREVYRSKFNEDRTMKVNNGYLELETGSMRKFQVSDLKVSKEVVDACIAALKKECGKNFYELS